MGVMGLDILGQNIRRRLNARRVSDSLGRAKHSTEHALCADTVCWFLVELHVTSSLSKVTKMSNYTCVTLY